jgi:hypothetical protein
MGRSETGLHTGTMFVALEQTPFLGWHWDLVAGDSQVSSNLLGDSASNISTPDISTRGFRVAVKRTNRTYQFFFGRDTLLGGQRVSYRLTLPQYEVGASMKQTVGQRLTFGVRFLRLDTDPSVLNGQSTFYFPGHIFRASDTLAIQSSYNLRKGMSVFGEASYTAATLFPSSPAAQHPLSYFAGWSWETAAFSARANYVAQSVTYLPVLGYFSGDRRGPFVDGHYHVTHNFELNGSAEAYSNNLENNASLPTFHSSGFSAGASYALPWALNVGASFSTLHLTTLSPAQPAIPSENRQFNVDISRAFRRHNLRFSYTDLKLSESAVPQTERFAEAEDAFTWKRLVLRGALRYQYSLTTETRNTFFVRGAAQINLKWISAYANFEKGNDLANRTVFSTNAYSTTVIGFTMPLVKGWNLQTEAFRTTLNTALNPENIFLFPTSDLAAEQLPGFQQWSGYFRITKSFSWGKRVSTNGGIDAYAAAMVPLVGTVQGRVMENSLAGARPSANVAVSLDSGRSVLTDLSGSYSFRDVPEGPHTIGLNLEQLPTHYEPGPNASERIVVSPRSLVRSDFSVVPLVQLAGRVAAPKGISLDNLVIRIAGSDRYTTPNQSGAFSFYNLKEGQYDVAIDPRTIPEGFLVSGPASLSVLAVDRSGPPAPIEFVLQVQPEQEKPIRQILQEQIHVQAGSQPTSNSTPAKNTPAPRK